MEKRAMELNITHAQTKLRAVLTLLHGVAHIGRFLPKLAVAENATAFLEAHP
jgi:hypothetical protein